MSRIATNLEDETRGADDTPFVKVTSRRNRKNNILGSETKTVKLLASPNQNQREPHRIPLFEVDEVNTLRKLQQAQTEITTSNWFKSILDKFQLNIPTPVQQIICFGIGNFSSCQISRFQLAFVLALKSQWKITRITFHEPILVSGEINLLESLDIEVYSKNVEGKFQVTDTNVPTLVYLPHCPKQLTNNFLWANWSPTLHNICLVCNSFEELIDSTPRRFLEVDAQYILRLRDFSKEFRLPNTFRYSDIFNDTSLHTFAELLEPSEDFWKQKPEPTYSLGATELITQLETLSLQP